MKRAWSIIILASLVGFVMSCGKKFTPTTTTVVTDYEEDLSAVRPKYEPKPVATAPVKKVEKTASNNTELPMHVNDRVNAALDTIAARNKNIKYMQGYRIQLYVGNSRDEANAAKAYLYQNFPELNAYMSFTQPTYRLKVGDFMSKIDAERYHVSMKQEYSASMIVPDKIDIRKSLLTK
ncbi:MAG: SPOR domain-containing protein [Spirosomataceae bacterium]